MAWPTFSTIFMIPKTSSKIVEKVEKICLANIFSTTQAALGGPNRGKCWPGQLFPRFSEEVFGIMKMVEKVGKSWPGHVFEAEIVEKVGQANFFHHFHDSKDFFRNLWEKWKKLAWPTFSTIWASKTACVVDNLVQANFFHRCRHL